MIEQNMMGGKQATDRKVEVPLVKDIVGKSVSKIGTYGQLNNKEQVVALIDEVGLDFIYSLPAVAVPTYSSLPGLI
jgi:hypothetical protein